MGENPSATLPATVEKTIKSPYPVSLKKQKSPSKGPITFIERFALKTVSPMKMAPKFI